MWNPLYTITPATAAFLMRTEAVRAAVANMTLPPSSEAELRRQARVRSTHFSTRIEGNRLTLSEAEQAIMGARSGFEGRGRDVREVRNYWNARLRVEEWAEAGRPVTVELIQRLHGLVEHEVRSRPTPWRDGQNSIRDAVSGSLVYLPPEAHDVPDLMKGMINWIGQAEREGIPVPIIAGLVHYQFVTIHPYYDGNGRTARLLATHLLQRGGYGLNGFLSIEEFYSRDLGGYYQALAVHPHHNYYEGRSAADLGEWLEYFINALASMFEVVGRETRRFRQSRQADTPDLLKQLDRRARVVLALFVDHTTIPTAHVATALGLSDRMARVLVAEWVRAGWLEVADASRKKRTYCLSAAYRQCLDELSAMPPSAEPPDNL